MKLLMTFSNMGYNRDSRYVTYQKVFLHGQAELSVTCPYNERVKLGLGAGYGFEVVGVDVIA